MVHEPRAVPIVIEPAMLAPECSDAVSIGQEVDERDVVTIFRLGHNFAVLALIALGRRFDEDDSFSDWSVLAAEEADLGQFLNGRSALARLCRCAGVQDSRR